MKFAKKIIEEIKERGRINLPESFSSGEEFERWLCEERNKSEYKMKFNLGWEDCFATLAEAQAECDRRNKEDK